MYGIHPADKKILRVDRSSSVNLHTLLSRIQHEIQHQEGRQSAVLNPTTSQVSRCLWTVSTRSYWATGYREFGTLGQGGEASHRFCWESRCFLTWSVGITRDVRHNDEEKFGGIIFGNSPRSGCAHFQNSSSFIFSKCSSYSKVKLYSRFKYFKFIRKTTISCCQQIGDRHQMPYTNTGDKMVMRRVSVCH